MNTILFDGPERKNFLPFTFTRPVADLRVGIMTFREKWEKVLDCKTSTQTEEYLSGKWKAHMEEENLFINPAFLPSENLVRAVKSLEIGEKLTRDEKLIAYKAKKSDLNHVNFKEVSFSEDPFHIGHSYELISNNGKAIEIDYKALTEGRESQKIPDTVVVKNPENIFIEEGAKLFNCSLNAEEGPIYIGKNAEVMEGAVIRGPFSLGEHSLVKMQAKIYGETSFGPHCKVGGEVAETIIIGYSNKAHDGFLGNSVVGEWCNLGADTNNSDLKNNYASVKLWNYEAERFLPTGMQFCGLMLGDHSKSAINTMFNTGTVVGVSSNIFGSGFPRNFVPSFTWGGASKMITYRTNKVFEVAQKVMARRNVEFTEEDQKILQHIFEETRKYRKD